MINPANWWPPLPDFANTYSHRDSEYQPCPGHQILVMTLGAVGLSFAVGSHYCRCWRNPSGHTSIHAALKDKSLLDKYSVSDFRYLLPRQDLAFIA